MISGRYALHGEIASGGMATVCFGRMVGAAGFARTVAVKRLHPHLARDPELSAMFRDEARLAARVRHPSVVTTLDVVADGDELFLVMDYVPGESLAALARAASPEALAAVPPSIAVSIIAGVLHGLHAAHEARGEDGLPLQIVHRDVSPQNILVGEDGLAHLIDFGIARAAVRSQATREGQLKGKLRYMAPEQLRGAPATRQADVYAAAVVLWEALAGARLFDGDTDGAIYGRILEGVVRPPSAFVAVPPALDAVVLRGLARDPAERFATAQEMADALERALSPAPPREVAAWLLRIAGPVLAERAARVREIEEGRGDGSRRAVAPGVGEGTLTSDRPAPGGAVDAHSHDGGGRVAPALRLAVGAQAPTLTMPVSVTTPPPSNRPLARRAAVAGGAFVSLLAAVALGVRLADGPPVPAARRGVAAAAFVASRSAGPAGAGEPAPRNAPEANAGATGSVGVASAAPAGSPAPPPRKASLARDVADAPVPARGLASARARSPCDPPYFVDPSGIRRVKRECL